MKILVIEDDTAISELICMNLEAAGYETQAIFDGNAAEVTLKTEDSDDTALALVDVMLPGKDGFELMEDLQRAQIPVIYLTAKDDVISKVHGLKSGAEDYIVKPFEVLELLVRIEKVLKRTGRGREKIIIRDVVIDLKEHSVLKNGKKVNLKPMEYEPLKNFSEVAANAYYHYVIKKYDDSMYILVEGEQVLCNLTPFELNNPGDDRWGNAEAYHIIQKLENRYILVMGIRLPVTGGSEYKLVLVRDISNIYEDIRTQAFFYVRIYLAAVFTTVVLVFLMIKKALAPLRELQRAAQDISEGRLERRAKVHTSDEIGDMAAAFNGMAAQIENQVTELSLESERRRQMLGSLTHEMKTPMTSIMGYADSLLHVNLKEEQKESALQHIYTECGRLVRISSKLMSLIGMYDNDSICMEEFSVRDLFSAVAEMEDNNLKKKKMTLSYSCHMEKQIMDKDLIISLLTNLVDNAVKASETGSEIIMEAKEDRIIVRDFGCGIPEEEISRVTEAFIW